MEKENISTVLRRGKEGVIYGISFIDHKMGIAISASKIGALSSGEFVSMVADYPDRKIELKAFHCEIQNDHAALKKEQDNYKPFPSIRNLDTSMVQRNYLQIKQDVEDLVNAEIEKMMGDPELVGLVVKK